MTLKPTVRNVKIKKKKTNNNTNKRWQKNDKTILTFPQTKCERHKYSNYLDVTFTNGNLFKEVKYLTAMIEHNG